MLALKLENISKWFGQKCVLRNVHLEVKEGEFLTLLGASGCGKSTTLKIIAGFLIPEEGAISIKGKDMTTVSANRRRTAMVFQNYALFPHLTAFENVAFGLRLRRENRVEIDRKVSEALELVRLPEVSDHYPSQLSGGQQQRVAVARALVMKPEVLLLDEPLSNLDAKLREQMRLELRDIQQSASATTVFVTHDIHEAFSMSDRIAVMNEGTIEQTGTPQEIYASPRSPFVAEFVGHSNRYQGIAHKRDDEFKVETHEGMSILLPGKFEGEDGGEIKVMIRPERVEIGHDRTASPNSFEGVLERVVFLGSQFELVVKLKGGAEVMVHEANRPGMTFQSGDNVWVSWSREDTIPIG